MIKVNFREGDLENPGSECRTVTATGRWGAVLAVNRVTIKPDLH